MPTGKARGRPRLEEPATELKTFRFKPTELAKLTALRQLWNQNVSVGLTVSDGRMLGLIIEHVTHVDILRWATNAALK